MYSTYIDYSSPNVWSPCLYFSDDVKVQLAKSDLKHCLIRKLKETENSSDEEAQSLMKLTADLIVLLLTGGE